MTPTNAPNFKALRLALEDLQTTQGEHYPGGAAWLQQLARLETSFATASSTQKMELANQFKSLQREALLANPALDFSRLLLVKRNAKLLGLPQNWQGNCALPRTGYDNELAILSLRDTKQPLTTLYQPGNGRFLGDVDLHFDGQRALFSSLSTNGPRRWQIYELSWPADLSQAAAAVQVRQVTPGTEPDVDNYDPCYLPDGNILFASTRVFAGVPCVGGGNAVANLFRMNADGTGTRQLCFDQEHNWCPTVMPDGRILYARWEYTDTPHYFTRLLFRMNPDGTGQSEFYGSNSPWPNSIFYARPIPGQPTKFVAVISGHHGVPRMGELILFDIALGRHQAAGAIQRIPGHGKPVVPVIGDAIVNDSWPKFLHPWPLTDRHFIVSMQPDAKSSWGLYLVDVFDNLVLLKEEPGYALMEPIPLRPTATPPVIPDRVDLRQKEATVYMNDVYFGQGLANVPRGSVKQLRLFAYHYAYPRMGGHIEIGIDGPWDVHRILGTVPVEADGSASFKVPANTPIAVQPLDADGRAVQVMRSWFTAMPGEKVSCIGCHESQNATAAALQPLAFNRTPSDITPWRGPARGFSFKREVQPVLERHCVRCHDGSQVGQPDFSLAHKSEFRHFTPSYVQLHRYVRRPGPESDYFLQKPLEFHASTSELIQMLEKGHHGVRLEAEAWDRLTTWIDLNVPDHGTWSENRAIASNYRERRQTMKTEYAQADEDPETIIATTPFAGAPALVVTPPAPAAAPAPVVPGWPFDAAQARQRQADSSLPARLSIKLANDTPLELVLIPAGEFVMGEAEGSADEQPLSRVRVEKPFYLARCETMNAQYAAFDPTHDSAFISVFNKDISKRGETANRATQPVLRVNWQQAMAYCAWLTKQTGRQFTLPTEAQWEYACRAGTATPLSYGALNTDFSRLANLADSRLESLCRGNSPKWLPAITNVNDGATVSDNTGRYPANAWGLLDMHGNVAEWTRSAYAPYPYHENDGRNEINSTQRRVVRGGSFYDRPSRARSGFRLAYSPWQAVFNVGFRVTCEVSEKPTVQARAR